MSLYSSFYASLSGLSTSASNLSVIGNNLANLNTIGFKGSSGTFQDLFAASLGSQGTQGNGNPIQIGLGTRLGGVTQNFGQGSYQSTSSVTDLAISGRGFFALQTKTGTRAYSRAGNFTVDKAGGLVDPNGNQVLGWNRSGGTVSVTGTPSPVQIDLGSTAGAAITTTMSAITNLNANATVPVVGPPAIAGSVYTTSMQVYDSLGATHNLIQTYTKTANTGEWSLTMSTDDAGATVDYNGTGSPTTLVQFDSAGILTSQATNPTISISNWTNGAASQTIDWTIRSGTPSISSLTGYASDSTTSNSVQNGYGAGTIQSLIVDQAGTITGVFSNGQMIPLAQVALAVFSNQNGLSKQGDNTWAETLASGSGNVGAANQGGRGAVLGGNLELSNVDVAEEFTKLIIAQRGYQANSRVVTTSDELLQETLNLKR